MEYKDTLIKQVTIDYGFKETAKRVITLAEFDLTEYKKAINLTDDTEQIAYMYLLDFVLGELEFDEFVEEAQATIHRWLTLKGYGTDIIYNNDAEPMIVWPDNFDWYKFTERFYDEN